ncbi:DUF3800 domain-containing protein [Lichenihabitans psoromatis]|uniref:DUF3800 domain-containing protein n=1 Tax=Lichenihabitans psoromatis TaxID=2528642 RepID=UPI001035CA3C|nr:DUF3800 domain-containing protein [Lichenihabitans psoromatis]
MNGFSDYIVYADESGDHSLTKVDSSYPVFVLCLCIFEKKHYVGAVVPAMQRLKFAYFGHDSVVLHEREIRKKENAFSFLQDRELYERFQSDLSMIVKRTRMAVVCVVIDKKRVRDDLFTENPYSIALKACVERSIEFLESKGQKQRVTHFLFEKRGDKEDKDLELEFRRIAGGQNRFRRPLPNIEIRMLDKKANSSGLQIADLAARPIGIKAIRPGQSNRAFDIIRPKIVTSSRRSQAGIMMSP